MTRETENKQALLARMDRKERELFLDREQSRILRIASAAAKRSLTYGDDEWSEALWAVSRALDGYEERRGDFWPYAALVIRSRLRDYWRKEARYLPESPMDPEDMERIPASSEEGIPLREEIGALARELKEFGISFFDLAECSPRTGRTRKACAAAVRAMFFPTSLMVRLRRSKKLPAGELMERCGLGRKLLERHRDYLIAAALILDGDYPALAEYLAFIREEER